VIGTAAAPSIAGFRDRIAAVLSAAEAPHIIVLGVDGIPYDLARRSWPRAALSKASSVFPTTSSTAWLSSLTGSSVDAHGVPGVMFEVRDGSGPLDVYGYKGALSEAMPETMFSDAARAGYTPVAIVGDLEDTDCAWRELLLHHALQVRGHRFFTPLEQPFDPAALCRRLGDAVDQTLRAVEGRCLLWCFIDADRYIHHHGYDAALIEVLEGIETLAVDWAHDGAMVIAHSDHGLTKTRHDAQVARTLDEVMSAHACRMGGAGRTRWLYVRPGTEAQVRAELTRRLPPSIRVCDADELFAPGSVARRRVGAIVLIAEGEAFLAPDAYLVEHGAWTDAGIYVPIAEGRGC